LIGWQVNPGNAEQSASVVHPGKQMNWLLPFSTQYVGWPAESSPWQSESTVQELVHQRIPVWQVPSLQSVGTLQGSPMEPDALGELQTNPVPPETDWQVVPGKALQSPLFVQPAKQTNWLLAFSIQTFVSPALEVPQVFPPAVQDAVHQGMPVMQEAPLCVQSALDTHGSPMLPMGGELPESGASLWPSTLDVPASPTE
jgi:hypothetical protein